ncbi:Tetratricopeptide repeat superfamily protein [Perilla frutescens var. frutescens]|nr:Tetratricopeptide repeat superfamily protein [Perilla frutescens var. frutescens]
MKSDLQTRDFDGFGKPGERGVPAAGEELKSGTPAVTRPQRPLALPMMALQWPLVLSVIDPIDGGLTGIAGCLGSDFIGGREDKHSSSSIADLVDNWFLCLGIDFYQKFYLTFDGRWGLGFCILSLCLSAQPQAYVYGFFQNKRIILYDTLIQQMELTKKDADSEKVRDSQDAVFVKEGQPSSGSRVSLGSSPSKKSFEGKDALSYADILRSRNKFMDAFSVYESLLEKDHESVEAHIGKGICLQMQNLSRLAYESFVEAVRLDPQNACALTHCGILFKDEGRLVEAAEFLVKKGHVATPHADYCLPRITRGTIRLGYEILAFPNHILMCGCAIYRCFTVGDHNRNHGRTHSKAEKEWKLAQSNMESSSSGLVSAVNELSIASINSKSALGEMSFHLR